MNSQSRIGRNFSANRIAAGAGLSVALPIPRPLLFLIRVLEYFCTMSGACWRSLALRIRVKAAAFSAAVSVLPQPSADLPPPIDTLHRKTLLWSGPVLL